MLGHFKSQLVGTFDNKKQAYSNPSYYAHIRLVHQDIGDGLIYGEQAYTYDLSHPYRQFALELIDEGTSIIVKNCDIKDKSRFTGFNNLEQLSREDLIHRSGCDLKFIPSASGYIGRISGCECFVQKGDKQTYVKSTVNLSENQYIVIDTGHCVESHTKLWGSEFGPFYFDKI